MIMREEGFEPPTIETHTFKCIDLHGVNVSLYRAKPLALKRHNIQCAIRIKSFRSDLLK